MRLNDSLMAEVKSYAARHGLTFTSVLEDALQRLLNDEKAGAEPDHHVDVVVFSGQLGVRVDVSDRDAVAQVLDDEDAEAFKKSQHART